MARPTFDRDLGRGSPTNLTPEFGTFVVQAPEAVRGVRLPLRMPVETIGREGSLKLVSATVSRSHARVWTADGQVFIEDVGSANGTLVNGKPLTRQLSLVAGDRVQFGDVQAVFHVGASSEPGPSPGDSTPEASHPHPARTETTRYLCAAAHLDRRYREDVLDATIRQTHRAVAPCYGVDLSVVARHAVLASRRALVRDAILTTLLAAAGIILVVWATSDEVGRVVQQQAWDRLATDAVGLLWVEAALAVAAWGVVAAETFVRFVTLGNYLCPNGQPDAAPVPGGVRTANLLAELARTNQGNVVVYSVYEPFVGSGVQVISSSYPVPLIPRSGDRDTPPRQPTGFSTNELLEALTDALHTLGLKGLRIDRRLFVDGLNVARIPDLLPDRRHRPVTSVPLQRLDLLTEHPGGIVRPYLCAEVTSWQGQLVVTTFVRVVVFTGILFIETATHVLAPLRGEYLNVDAMRIRTGGERLIETIRSASARFLPALLTSPMRLAAAAGARRAAVRNRRQFHRLLADNVVVDRGATSSIRQQASSDRFYRYFMQLDADMFASVVNEKVADTVAAFLEARGYQTDKINLIQNHISNTVNDNSMRIGNVSGAGIAIGDGSRARAGDAGHGTDRSGPGSGRRG